MKNIHPKWLFLMSLSLIWGSSFILIKKALLGFTPFQLGALRSVLTGLILLVFGVKYLKYIPKEKWKWIALSGFLGSFFPAFLFAFAQTEIDSSIASILNSLVPLNTTLIGLTIFKIISTKRQILGVMIGFVGTAILIFEGADVNPDQNYFYALFVITATVMYAFNVNIIKRYLQDVKPLAIATGNYLVIFLPALLVLIFSGFFTSKTIHGVMFMEALGFVAILALFGTAMAKVIFNRLVQISTPVFASSATYLMPVIALLWGVLDGEGFSVLQALATFIILLGVYLSHKRKKPE
ncbi:DMT family transporter [Mangrovimonas spongiae]|uniref:Permease n=1 Tax=Mangrovimonas spongiae TaxID=2494697 RepID=A0A3R9MJD9_9FLAO|nr:EamA family transporter [Mangrovimonas spongiae]RSK41795.1 permease [Mangrovimonas spongiae]